MNSGIEQKRELLFAIDYDETITADRDLFLSFMRLLNSLGHKCIIVTMRYPVERITDQEIIDETVGVFYTSRNFKQAYMQERGVQPDIWIDDTPLYITGGLTIRNGILR